MSEIDVSDEYEYDTAVLEAIPLLDEVLAREITDLIREGLEHIWRLVVVAYHGRAWWALKYGSWDQYCATEFGGKLRLPRADRQQVVCFLREAGLSIRAIAASPLGISQQTVQRDLASGVMNHHTCDETDESDGVVVPFPPQQSDSITGLDGKQHPAKRRKRITPAIQDKFVKQLDSHLGEVRYHARAIRKMCKRTELAAHDLNDLRIVQKLLSGLQDLITEVLAETPEQTNLFDMQGTDDGLF